MPGPDQDALGGAEFLPEAEDLLEALGRGLQRAESELAEGGVPAPRINELFRAMHSLKGLAGMFGRTGLSALTHGLEDFLDRLRMGRAPFGADALDLLFDALEQVERLLSRDGEPPAGLMDRLAAPAAGPQPKTRREGPAGLPDDLARALTTYEEHRLRERLASSTPLWLVDLSLPLESFDETLRSLAEELGRRGEVISTLPRYSAGDDGQRLSFRLLLATPDGEEELRRQVGPDAVLTPLAGAPGTDSDDRGDEAAPDDGEARLDRSTVRVRLARLDRLLDAVGELLVFRHDVDAIARRLRELDGARSLAEQLQRATRELDKRLQELQRSVIGARLVPVARIAGRISRLVRKLSRSAGKEVVLRLEGGGTELDKMLIDRLQSPLIHLVRNAIHHGIESPEERAAAGKPAQGSLRLRAAQRGNTVVLTLADDGRGVVLEDVRRAALRRGLLGPDEELDSARACELIFEPGFSSAREVGQVSGRGVGLDVVRRELQFLGGSVRMASAPGQGACVEIVLPITLAIMPCMVVRSGGQEFAMPVAGIAETLRFRQDRMDSVARRPVLRLRGETLPYTDLGSLFRLAASGPGPGYVVVTRAGEGRMAMGVDELLGQHEVVIKPVGRHLDRLPGVAGATELGEGRAALVLDLPSLAGVATAAPAEAP